MVLRLVWQLDLGSSHHPRKDALVPLGYQFLGAPFLQQLPCPQHQDPVHVNDRVDAVGDDKEDAGATAIAGTCSGLTRLRGDLRRGRALGNGESGAGKPPVVVHQKGLSYSALGIDLIAGASP